MTDENEGTGRPAKGGAGGLEDEVRALREELTAIREHRMVMMFQSVPRVLMFRFATGMAVGLGTVIGATVLLSVLVWTLSQIEFIPIIGQWASEIREIMSVSPDAEQ